MHVRARAVHQALACPPMPRARAQQVRPRSAHALCAQLRAVRAGPPDFTACLRKLMHVRARAHPLHVPPRA
eukprot:10868520-Alexandrium_andersonii.AAC.1